MAIIRHGHGKGPKSLAFKELAPTEQDKRAVVQALMKGDTTVCTSKGQFTVRTERRG